MAPLKSGKSRPIISQNIQKLMREGYNRSQAAAIAMSKSGYPKKKPKSKTKKSSKLKSR